MMRQWFSVALLAGGWQIGLGYYSPPHIAAWCAMLGLAIWLLRDIPIRWPRRRLLLPALIALLPAVLVMPMPFKTLPLVLAGGLGLRWLAIPHREAFRWSSALVICGAVLSVQAAATWAYAMLTARGHELPSSISVCLGPVLRWLGLDAAVEGSWLIVRHADQVQRFSATWDLLFDPASTAFFFGGLVLLGLVRCSGSMTRAGGRSWASNAWKLFGIFLAWAPLRSAVLIALVLQRALRADATAEPNVASVLVNDWIHAALLLGPFAMAACLLRELPRQRPPARPRSRCPAPRRWPAIASSGSAVALAILAWTWCPIGEPAAGRVMVVERHSTWESTEVPYGTEVYGEAGSYNYAAAYAYCGQFYAMSRLLESQAIDDAKLADCDVLIIKTPTARYEKQEVDAVVRFVARGGSLLLIGDHTNVFNMNTYLNDITRRFGFSFRNDLLFRVGSPYRQAYVPSWPPHPIVQHVPSMDFAVSCSIDPGFSRGRSVIRNSGLYNLPPAYHESNYHPQAEYRPAMQYGAWCQLWETRHGRGRVLAFADSTLFSNFCVYQPGKAELLRGMVDWLNHRESPAAAWGASLLRSLLLAASVALMIVGLRLAWKTPGSWMLLLGWSLGAGTVTCLALAGWQRSAMPVPVAERPLPHIGIDRGLSDVPLFTGAFADDDQGFGYGMFEQWIPRLGVTMSRVYTTENFRGQGLVVICPTRSVQDQTLDQLTQYVHQGGRLLVLDSPDVGDSTANSLLQPFGLTIRHDLASQIQGDLVWPDAAEIPVESLQTSCAVTGGQPLATIQGTPVAAQVAWGQGTVTAVGFGSLFNDAAMGFHWLPEPDPALLQRYQVLYHLLRCAVSPPPPPRMQSPTTPSQTTQVRGG